MDNGVTGLSAASNAEEATEVSCHSEQDQLCSWRAFVGLACVGSSMPPNVKAGILILEANLKA